MQRGTNQPVESATTSILYFWCTDRERGQSRFCVLSCLQMLIIRACSAKALLFQRQEQNNNWLVITCPLWAPCETVDDAIVLPPLSFCRRPPSTSPRRWRRQRRSWKKTHMTLTHGAFWFEKHRFSDTELYSWGSEQTGARVAGREGLG